MGSIETAAPIVHATSASRTTESAPVIARTTTPKLDPQPDLQSQVHAEQSHRDRAPSSVRVRNPAFLESPGAEGGEPALLHEVVCRIEREDGVPLGPLARRNVAATLGVLERLGISTRDKFNRWVQANRWHDLKVAIISGLFLECGYLLGMLLGNEGYFDAPHSLQHAWPQLYKAVTETASGEGLWLGDAVGGCDAGAQVMGAWYQALAQRAGQASHMPADLQRWSPLFDVIVKAVIRTLINGTKNLPRVVLPYAQRDIERRFFGRTDGLVDLKWSRRADVMWDGIFGLLQGVLKNVIELVMGGGVTYMARLLAQPEQRFTRVANNRSALAAAGVSPMPASASAFTWVHYRPRGRGDGTKFWLAQVIVPLFAVAIVGITISQLFSRNQNILDDGHKGLDLPAGRADPNVLSAKAASSTQQMGDMTLKMNLGIPAIEWVIEKAVDFAFAVVDGKRPRLSWPSFLREALPCPPADELESVVQTLFPDGGDAAVEPHAQERHASVAEDGTPAVTPAPVVDPKRTDAQTKDRAAGRVSIKGVD